jgi:hypothetical protein
MAPAAEEGLLATALRREGRVLQIRHEQALFVEGDRAGRVFLLQRGKQQPAEPVRRSVRPSPPVTSSGDAPVPWTASDLSLWSIGLCDETPLPREAGRS